MKIQPLILFSLLRLTPLKRTLKVFNFMSVPRARQKANARGLMWLIVLSLFSSNHNRSSPSPLFQIGKPNGHTTTPLRQYNPLLYWAIQFKEIYWKTSRWRYGSTTSLCNTVGLKIQCLRKWVWSDSGWIGALWCFKVWVSIISVAFTKCCMCILQGLVVWWKNCPWAILTQSKTFGWYLFDCWSGLAGMS